MPVSAAPTTLHAPRSPGDLFISFSLLALQGFGGVLAVAQRELVERRRWMSNEEFVEEWAVAQILPGPNIVNLSLMLGARHFGLRGALAALAGMLTAPLLLLLVIALLYAQTQDHPAVAGALRGMGAIAAGLLIATGLKLTAPLSRSALGPGGVLTFGLLCFAAIALLHWPLVWVLAGLGLPACALAYRKLRP